MPTATEIAGRSKEYQAAYREGLEGGMVLGLVALGRVLDELTINKRFQIRFRDRFCRESATELRNRLAAIGAAVRKKEPEEQ